MHSFRGSFGSLKRSKRIRNAAAAIGWTILLLLIGAGIQGRLFNFCDRCTQKNRRYTRLTIIMPRIHRDCRRDGIPDLFFEERENIFCLRGFHRYPVAVKEQKEPIVLPKKLMEHFN